MHGVALIGFGEAGRSFAGAPHWRAAARAFDLKLRDPATRPAMALACERCGVAAAASPAEALTDAAVVISLVTAGQALDAATDAARVLRPGALFCDGNSVAPETKRAAARIVEAAGGRYVDMAVMAPVLPARLVVPLLVAGPHADAASAALAAIGFANVRGVAGGVGAASAIKMIRSVMVKGLEALTAECFLAAEAAGVRAEVTASLDASWPDADWAARADYNLDRMMVHGSRRAEEMGEVVKTLEALRTGSAMSRGTAARQRAIGALGIAPPAGLDAKLATLRPFAAPHRDAA